MLDREMTFHMRNRRVQWEVAVDYAVPSVVLAAQALKLLSRHKYRSCSLKDIAEKLGASPTTCLRVLRTLEREDFVCFDADSKRYSLGPYLIPLGNRAAELNDAVARATREIRRLAAATGLTTALIQRWDDRLVYIAAAEPPATEVRLSIAVGQQVPMTRGAHGRCFLAYDQAAWRRLETGPDHQRLLVAAQEVRRNGYAISHGELTPGFSAVDVPIFDKAGRVELVIACMYVTAQLDEQQLADIIALLRASSARLFEWSGARVGMEEISLPTQGDSTTTPSHSGRGSRG
jgi:DNA-binding IclR family transcriptional regulator